MSHVTGTVQILGPPIGIGPDFGTNTQIFVFRLAPPQTPPGGIKFVILHFTGGSFPGSNRLEVNLGYDTDVFNAADGANFWTRPINVSMMPGGQITMDYIVDGDTGGGIQLIEYGRGERHEEHEAPHDSYSNSDPFLKDGDYTEPQYDPYWYCNSGGNVPPHWENVACLPAGDIRENSFAICVHAGGCAWRPCIKLLRDIDWTRYCDYGCPLHYDFNELKSF